MPAEQGLMQAVGVDPQDPLHESMSPAGQAQHVQTSISTMSTRPLSPAGLKLKLQLESPHASAHRGLMQGQIVGRCVLRAAELQNIQNMDILKQ